MALILGAFEGDSIFIGDHRLTVVEVTNPYLFKVLVEDMIDSVYTVTHSQRVEVLPDVFLSAGRPTEEGMVKLVFEAPRDKVILRERLYRQRATRDSV
jgi:sRNA-binding carbon storage regulator CsrA